MCEPHRLILPWWTRLMVCCHGGRRQGTEAAPVAETRLHFCVFGVFVSLSSHCAQVAVGLCATSSPLRGLDSSLHHP